MLGLMAPVVAGRAARMTGWAAAGARRRARGSRGLLASAGRPVPTVGPGGPLGRDQALDPRQVVLGGLVVVLHEAAGVTVRRLAACPQAGSEVSEPLEQLGPAPLEHAEAGVGREVAGERQPQVEHPVVIARLALGGQQLLEEGLARSVMP